MKSRITVLLSLFTVALAATALAADRPPLLAAGTAAPEFTAYRPDGTAVRLADFRGKPVLIDFWATWCGPCKQAMPHLEALHQKLSAQGLTVLGVCVWDKKQAFDAWQTAPQVPTSYLKVFDPAGRAPSNIAQALYRVSGIPTFYLVDADGKVLFSGVGSGPETEHRLDAALKRAGFKL